MFDGVAMPIISLLLLPLIAVWFVPNLSSRGWRFVGSIATTIVGVPIWILSLIDGLSWCPGSGPSEPPSATARLFQWAIPVLWIAVQLRLTRPRKQGQQRSTDFYRSGW
jgi:hypothetical protein